MFTLALLLSCASAEPDADAVFAACLAAVDAACDCWIESAGWGDMPYGQHSECVNKKVDNCDVERWTLEEIEAFVTSQECTPIA